MTISIFVADHIHTKYAQAICDEIYMSAQERGTGIARRTPEYVIEKIEAGKAVIALTDSGEFAGFSYIETWGHKQFVANSGLIVSHKFRKIGLASKSKQRIFALSRELFPDAKIFSITTGHSCNENKHCTGNSNLSPSLNLQMMKSFGKVAKDAKTLISSLVITSSVACVQACSTTQKII